MSKYFHGNEIARLFNKHGWRWSSSPPTAADIDAETVAIWRDDRADLSLDRVRSAGSTFFLLRFGDLCTVGIAPKRRIVWMIEISHGASRAAVDHCITGQLIPRIIAHEKKLVLHAGFVASDTEGAIICGPSGRGKSTLAASLQMNGYQLHSDDSACIEKVGERYFGRAVNSTLRLRPDILKYMYSDSSEVTKSDQHSGKSIISLPARSSERQLSVSVNAMIFLALPPYDDTISLGRIHPAKVCLALIENSFALDPTDRQRAQQKLVMASDLAAAVPAYELSYPRDYDRLDDVRRTLVEEGILPPPDQDAVSPPQVA